MIYTLILYCYLLWIVFIAGMATKAIWPTLAPMPKVLLVPIGCIGVALDIVFNMCIATVVLLDFPRELLFTSRLERYKDLEKSGWRHRFAIYFCRNFLDPFQVGGHCK